MHSVTEFLCVCGVGERTTSDFASDFARNSILDWLRMNLPSREGKYLSAKEHTVAPFACVRDALDNLLCNVHVQRAGPEVVKEEQGGGARRDDVVHAHCNEILANSLVCLHLERDLQLRSDAVAAGNEVRVPCVFAEEFDASPPLSSG